MRVQLQGKYPATSVTEAQVSISKPEWWLSGFADQVYKHLLMGPLARSSLSRSCIDILSVAQVQPPSVFSFLNAVYEFDVISMWRHQVFSCVFFLKFTFPIRGRSANVRRQVPGSASSPRNRTCLEIATHLSPCYLSDAFLT